MHLLAAGTELASFVRRHLLGFREPSHVHLQYGDECAISGIGCSKAKDCWVTVYSLAAGTSLSEETYWVFEGQGLLGHIMFSGVRSQTLCVRELRTVRSQWAHWWRGWRLLRPSEDTYWVREPRTVG